VIHDADGHEFPYDPMPYQEEFHINSINCMDKPPDRITKKCRGTGATCCVCMDMIVAALKYENISIPFSSITAETGSEVLRWLIFLVDNASIELGRAKNIKSRIEFPPNHTLIFQVPGNNPKVYRTFRSPCITFDEYAHCDNQEELWSSGRRCLSEGGQHNVLSTPGTNTDMYWKTLLRATKMGFLVFNWTLFPERYYDRTKKIFETVDQEYIEYYEKAEYKKMRQLCIDAWNAGMWSGKEVSKELADEPYHGKWPSDRGLIPIAPWIDLKKLENDRISNLASFMRENMGSIEEAGGALLPATLIDAIAKIPVSYRHGWRIGSEEKQENPQAVYVGGWDFGGEYHLAAFSMFKESGDGTYYQVLTETFPKMDMFEQEETMIEIKNLFPGLYLIGIDTSGAGQGFGDLCERDVDCHIVKMHMSSSETVGKNIDRTVKSSLKKASATNLRVKCYKEEVYLLDDLDLKREFNSPREVDLRTKARKIRGNIDHADRFWASAYALYAPKLYALSVPSIASASLKEPRGAMRKISPRIKAMRILQNLGVPDTGYSRYKKHRLPPSEKNEWKRKY
jgi:hypothetical protein